MDRKEFEDRALEYLDAVYRMALQLARHPDEASDLVQETYLKALRAAPNFQEQGGGIRPWLFKILHNVFYSRVSRQQRGPISVEGFHDQSGSEPLPDDPPPAWNLASLDWDHVDQRLKKAIEGLSTEYREVLLLWGVEGLKYRQIAHILDVPIGTVMSRLHRARAILIRELGPVADELGLALPEADERPGDVAAVSRPPTSAPTRPTRAASSAASSAALAGGAAADLPASGALTADDDPAPPTPPEAVRTPTSGSGGPLKRPRNPRGTGRGGGRTPSKPAGESGAPPG